LPLSKIHLSADSILVVCADSRVLLVWEFSSVVADLSELVVPAARNETGEMIESH
jgi:hypothetical protein